jgi:hypothetical protein
MRIDTNEVDSFRGLMLKVWELLGKQNVVPNSPVSYFDQVRQNDAMVDVEPIFNLLKPKSEVTTIIKEQLLEHM